MQRQSRRGFSLIELLVVMAILGLLLGMSVPVLSDITRSGNANRAIAGVASTLDLAREYAVARNTYTWVIFAANPDDPQGHSLYAAIVGSQDGSPTVDGAVPVDLGSAATYDLAASGNIQMLQRINTFPGAVIEPLASSPAPSAPDAVNPNSSVSFTFPGSESGAVAFLNTHPDAQRVVQFNPTGQARVSGSMVQMVELGLKPMEGTTPDEDNVAAIQVDGLTGQTQVYRR